MNYESVVEKNIDFVYRTAWSYCKNRADADDIVQNTFAKLLESKTEFTDEEHIRRWLIRVAINECKNMRKSFWRRNVDSIEDLELPSEAAEYLDESQSRLLDEIRRLPSKYSIVIHLYYYEDYNVKEIAKLLGISQGNVQQRLFRARAKLRKQMEQNR